MTAPTVEEVRAIRRENYRIKRAAGMKCGACGKEGSVLAVEQAGDLPATTRCENCLDKRKHKVRPHQFDEAAELQERLRKAG